MVDEVAAIGAVLLLMFVTIATRIGGVWIMSYVEITPRIEAFLQYMAASPRIWLAVGAAIVAMATTGSALGAMLIGTALAAFARSIAY